ncbi:hypothetical protein AAY473_021339 [Plecturocebus cupreus]
MLVLLPGLEGTALPASLRSPFGLGFGSGDRIQAPDTGAVEGTQHPSAIPPQSGHSRGHYPASSTSKGKGERMVAGAEGLFPAFPLNWGVGSPTHSPTSGDPPGLPSDGPALPGSTLEQDWHRRAAGDPISWSHCAPPSPFSPHPGLDAAWVLPFPSSLASLPAAERLSSGAFSVTHQEQETPSGLFPASPTC